MQADIHRSFIGTMEEQHMSEEFEKNLAFHCGPALAGIKAANLISCSKKKYPDFELMIEQYRSAFQNQGIRFEIIYQCSENYLLLMFREKVLRKHLERDDVKEILKWAGYPPESSMEDQLGRLKKRFFQQRDFPHEIGAFLGYPPGDIVGFLEHRGKDCKLCGHWKVYCNVEEAKRCFERYDRCRAAICRRISQGISITQLFCPA